MLGFQPQGSGEWTRGDRILPSEERDHARSLQKVWQGWGYTWDPGEAKEKQRGRGPRWASEAKEHQVEKQSKTAMSSNWSKIPRAKMKTHHSDPEPQASDQKTWWFFQLKWSCLREFLIMRNKFTDFDSSTTQSHLKSQKSSLVIKKMKRKKTKYRLA